MYPSEDSRAIGWLLAHLSLIFLNAPKIQGHLRIHVPHKTVVLADQSILLDSEVHALRWEAVFKDKREVQYISGANESIGLVGTSLLNVRGATQ